MSQTNPNSDALPEQPIMSHLLELRNRVLKSVLAISLIFLPLLPFSQEIFTFFAKPIIDLLPEGTSMVAIDVTSPFFTPFKLVMVLAFFVSIPFILHQMWGFVVPALYAHEKRLIMPLLVSSTLLFYLGALFAYWVVLPIILTFMQAFTPDGVAMAPDIARYLDFVLTLFFAFGIAFEVPIATIVAVWSGMTTPTALREKRPFVIVGAFIIGMLLTPPDVVSQTLLAVPMWLLYELGIIFSRFYMKKPGEDDEQNDYTPPTEDEVDAELNEGKTFETTAQTSAEKIELAKQFIQQEDYDSARVMLNEVLEEGTESEKVLAKALLEVM
ncbi:MAG: twin-arginine translocase subunit TatC [Methylococcales bacterium]|jgi:sec-independent protein translocase protein TatC|nr:twin-arginine translocase subunit TatC [Methylococcales bacterium]MBT7444328.1 twin-arginine translocase subunit TatC [Methylococcales bacterium]